MGRTSEPVVVLSGGLSHEREVSLRSGRRVSAALRSAGHEVVESDLAPTLLPLLGELTRPVVFSTLHGGAGEDGALREVFDLLDVAYVGSTGRASRTAFDKAVSTPLVATAGVRTPHQTALPQDMFRELGASVLVSALAESLGFPMLVKPSRSGSALGVTRVKDATELPAAIVTAFGYGDVAIIEEYIDGRELAVSVIDTGDGPQALPAVEIQPRSGFYDYTARYTAGETTFHCPADLSDEVSRACAQMALTAHRVLGLRDLSRTDLIVSNGAPVFLEVNVAPGMTQTSLLPLAIEASRLRFADVCSRLVTSASARQGASPSV